MEVRNIRNKYPLWYLLSPENRGRLATFQWEKFGVEIVIPPYPYSDIEVHTKRSSYVIPTGFMSETPNYPISVEGRR